MVSPGSVAFTIFGMDVAWYGVLIGFAFLLAGAIAYYRAPRHGVDRDHFLTLLIWLIPSALIGARAYYVIFRWDYYSQHLNQIFNTRGGGLAIHGGVILGFIVAYFVCKYYKEKFFSLADLCCVVLPLAQAIGRWGNFFNEEAHGVETDLPFAQIIDGVGYHPTFLYESVWCFLLFVFLLWMDSKHRKFDGQITCLYGILYSFERFFVEGLRTDSLMIGDLRQAQVISIVIFVGGIILYVILKKYNEAQLLKAEENSTDENIEKKES